MEKIIPISDLQSRAKDIVNGVKASHDPVIITQRGRPSALIVNYDHYESLLHTADEMSYPDWREKLIEAENDSHNKMGVSLESLRKKVRTRRNGR